MSQLWTINGVLQLNADGSLIYDVSGPLEHCCCECPFYYCIYERQLAAGWTTAWDSGDPANPAKFINYSCTKDYTLGELVNYVRALCSYYWSSTIGIKHVADDTPEDTLANLIAFTKTLMDTGGLFTGANCTQENKARYMGQSANNEISYANAVTNAAADWHDDIANYGGAQMQINNIWYGPDGNGKYYAIGKKQKCDCRVANIYDVGIAHQLLVYGGASNAYAYPTQWGVDAWPADSASRIMWESAVADVTPQTAAPLVDDMGFPTPWNGSAATYYLWELSPTYYAIRWDFTCL